MSTENTETFETFESFDGGSEEMETFDNMENEETEKPVKEKVKEDLKPIKDSQTDAEGKVIKEDGEEKKEKVAKRIKKEETFDDEGEEETEPTIITGENELPEDKKGGKLRIRMGDGDLYNIDALSTVPVKIDGKVEEVPMQELINNYSGKTAWDKKFTEIGKEKKTIEFEKNAIQVQKDKLTEHVNNALAPIRDASKNPLDSLLYLVEMSGEDPYAAYRRIMEANLEELTSLMDMGETERELYFHKKKDELHGKVAKQRNERTSKDLALNQAIEKVNQLRQAHNVTEDEFVDASEELEESFKAQGLDANSITEEQVVDFASLKPHIVSVKELIEPYEDNISDEKYGDVVAQLSRNLRDGKVDKKGISEILKRNFSVDEEVKELNTKLYQKQSAKKPAKKVESEESMEESFDDWD